MKLTKIALACLVATSTMAPQFASADDSLEFHGYGRWGTMYEADGNLNIGADGSIEKAAGRMGNEGFGGEWLLQKKFEGDNGTKWDLGIMLEHWGTLGMKQFYAGGSNIFESQPDAYLWAGRVFHSRVQQDLNDYYVVISDSQGIGVKNLDLGFAKLEVGVVGGRLNGDSGKTIDEQYDGSNNTYYNYDEGNYAFTSKLSDIAMGPVSMDLLFNYGFNDDTVDADLDEAYLGMVKLSGWNQNFYARYSNNVSGEYQGAKFNNVLNKANDVEAVYLSLDGGFSLGENTGLNYLTSYTDATGLTGANGGDGDYDKSTYNVIVRVTQQWNNIHSTWIEAGTAVVDFDDSAKENNTASKISIQHNMAISGTPWSRPMVKVFATVGTEENAGEKSDPVIVGALFEAWW